MRLRRSVHPYLVLILIAAPFLLWAMLLIMPTFDDWTTLSSPNHDPHFMQYFLPFGPTWRPGDALFGYINGLNYKLFPALNHVMIWLAHLGSTFLVWLISRQLGFNRTSRSIATAFFFFSPCMLGTTLSVDGLNQSYCHLWGMMALWAYLCKQGRLKWVLCAAFVLLSTFAKDNGIAWAVAPPVVAWGFGRIDKRTLAKHFAYGLALAAAYGAVRLSFPYVDTGAHEHEQEFRSLASKVSGTAKWVGYTWLATDYIALLHKPSRNLLVAFATFVASVPFILTLFLSHRQVWKSRTTYALLACLFIVASPNLLIAMSVMNAYSSLGIAALLVGWMANQFSKSTRWLNITFILYLASALFVDAHHWYMAWQTSLPGMEMAAETVRKTGKPVRKVYCIIIRDTYPKYSSFCVPYDEAYGWGHSVWQITGYTWPESIKDTTLAPSATALAEARILALRMRQKGFDCVWIANKGHVEVMK